MRLSFKIDRRWAVRLRWFFSKTNQSERCCFCNTVVKASPNQLRLGWRSTPSRHVEARSKRDTLSFRSRFQSSFTTFPAYLRESATLYFVENGRRGATGLISIGTWEERPKAVTYRFAQAQDRNHRLGEAKKRRGDIFEAP